MQLARWCYAVAATAFVAGLVVQVYLVGLAVVAGRIGFAPHVSLGHALALPLLVMLVAASVGRTGRRTVRLTWLLFAVYVVQANVVMVVRASAPAVGALHPVLALVEVVLGIVLVRAGWAVVARPPAPSAVGAEAPAS